jgi:hypothetical protein
MSGIQLGLAGNVSLCCDMGLVGKYLKNIPKYSKYVTYRGGGRAAGRRRQRSGSRAMLSAEQQRQSGRGASVAEASRRRRGEGGARWRKRQNGGDRERETTAVQGDGREAGRRQRWSIGMGDNRGGQWRRVSASEVAGCGWWRRGRSAKCGSEGGIVIF